jgi:hypothetical protein
VKHGGDRDRDDKALPMPVAGEADMRGPRVGGLYVIEDGTRIRVTGRAWRLFDKDDLIEVAIEKKSGGVTHEQVSMEQFEALAAGAKLAL